jgi:hypothetical protein
MPAAGCECFGRNEGSTIISMPDDIAVSINMNVCCDEYKQTIDLSTWCDVVEINLGIIFFYA